MGFFSFDCKACGHPLLSPYAVNGNNDWMEDGVAVMPNGSIIKGGYDGYGRLDGTSVHEGITCVPDCYHAACWGIKGKPDEYQGGSEDSHDQGYFFNPPDHDIPKPETEEDVAKALEAAEALKVKRGQVPQSETDETKPEEVPPDA